MAIESTNFFSFLKQTRSPIGLVDQYNLSEIYQSDQREALENLLLNPEGLDQIAGLSNQGLLKEDIRLIGGLESPVIFSLGLFDEVKPKITFDLSTYIRVGDPIGEPGKHSYVTDSQSDNIITVHGGLAAKNIEYNYLDLEGNVKTTSVSTSRESLFNSQANDNGEYTEASYPGLLRVRRRGHFNEIKLGKKLFVEKTGITESPGAVMKIPTYMKTTALGSTPPDVKILEVFASKNSPLEIPIKKLGTISFSIGAGTIQNVPYYFGFEIKRKRDGAPVVSKPNIDVGSSKPASYNVSFNLNGTIGNNVDCILSIYCTPSLVTDLNLSGLGIKEDAGRDLGLVGFDNLEVLNLDSNELQNIPTWLKVNYKTLTSLSLGGNSFWNNGPIKYFDWQESPGKAGSAGGAAPILSATQVLCYSGFRSAGSGGNTGVAGDYTDYDGTLDTVRDSNDRLFKQVRHKDVDGDPSCSIDESNGFRVFSALKSLTLRSSFYLRNADFSKIFPNLTNINLARSGDNAYRVEGNAPKINNNGDSSGISYNLSDQHNIAGNIRWVGSVPQYSTSADSQFIGQFKIKLWNTYHAVSLTGGICTDADMIASGKVADVDQDSLKKYSLADSGKFVEAWSGWLDNLESLTLHRNDIALNIADGNSLVWKKLKAVNINYTGDYGTRKKVKYNVSASGTVATDVLNANDLTSISAWRSGWGGKIFSIKNSKSLKSLSVGTTDWDGYSDGNGNEYVLPSNFVENTLVKEDHGSLETLALHYMIGGSSKNLQFRSDEFEYMSNLTYLLIKDSYFFGVFPSFVKDNSETIRVDIRGNRFYNLDNLGTDRNTRFRTIQAENQGISRGGALIPSYSAETANNQSKLYYVQFQNSLHSKYSSSWNDDTSKRNKICFEALFGASGTPSSYGITADRNGISGETFTSKNVDGTSSQESQFLFPTTDNAQLLGYIRVGDKVYEQATGGSPVGTVAQVKNGPGARLILKESKNYTNKTLYFQRSAQDVTGYFSGCKELRYVYLQSCSLGATIPTFKGNNGVLERARLQNNLFVKYEPGTLANISGQAINKTSRPMLKEFNVSSNPLTKTSIRDIISDAYEMAKFHNNQFFTLQINLRSTKANIAEGTLSNYTLDEIFDQGSSGNSSSNPPVSAIPDPLRTKFNQMGPGKKYSRITILLN